MDTPNPASTEENQIPKETPLEPTAQSQMGADQSSRPGFLERLRKAWTIDAWPISAVLLLTFLFYLPALNFQFVWDDGLLVNNLPLLLNPEAWAKALFRYPALAPNQFRPLGLLILLGEHRLGAGNPLVFHLVSIVLHIINTSLVYALLRRLIYGVVKDRGELPVAPIPLLAGGIALLYGVYPALIEGVAFISSQFELLMTTFLLLALVLEKVKKDWLRALWLGICFFLALLCKETAWGFVLAMPFWQLARWSPSLDKIPSEEGKPVKISRLKAFFLRYWSEYLAVLLALGIYLTVRWAALGYVWTSIESQQIAMGSILERSLLFVKTLATYLVLSIWPFTSISPLHLSALPVKPTDVSAWLALALLIVLAVCLVWLVRRYRRAGWLAVGAVLALLPVANLISLELVSGIFAAERFLVFPVTLTVLAFGAVVGASIPEISASLLRTPRQFKWTMPVIILAIWLAASVVTLQLALPNWSSDEAIWMWATRRLPHASLPLTNLAYVYNNRGQYEGAAATAQKAINLDNQDASAWNDLGLAYFFMGQYTDAQAAFDQATKIEPDEALFWNNLAGALREQDKLAEAEKILLENALSINPDLPAAHVSLGLIYLRSERPDLAYTHLQYATQVGSASEVAEAQSLLEQAQQPDLWLRLGERFMSERDYQKAASAYNNAAGFGAPVADAAYGFTTALIELKDFTNAKSVLEKVLAENPPDARLYYNLGIINHQQGDIEAARQAFTKALELAPDWDLPSQALEALPQP